MSSLLRSLILIRCLARRDYDRATTLLASPDMDARDWARFVVEHRLAGLAWKRLSEGSLTGYFDSRDVEGMRAYYVRQWAKNERLVREASSIAECLDGNGWPHVFLKGPFFASRFYGDVDERAISDLDLLIFSTADLFAVEALIEGRGYRRTSWRPLGHGVTSRVAHHYTYRRDDLALELHWNLQSHYSFRIACEEILRRAARVELSGRSYPVADDLDELTLQILSAFVDAQIGDFRFRTVIDIYLLLRLVDASTDWDRYLQARRAEGLEGICASILSYSLWLLDCADEIPSLASHLGGRCGETSLVPEDIESFFTAGSADLMAKVRNFRLYDAPVPLSALWWMVSLPVRLGVYR